jgi:soluble lytic murein transglycosylase
MPLAIAAVLSALLPAGAAHASALARTDSLFACGEESYAAADFDDAARWYASAAAFVEALPGAERTEYLEQKLGRARFLQGRCHERARDWDSAIDAFSRCLVELPEVGDAARMALARCYAAKDMPAKADELLRGVIDADHRTTLYQEAVEQLADTHREAGDFDIALQWYRVLLSESAEYETRARANYKIGLTYEGRGDRDAALCSFATVVDEFGRSSSAYDALKEARRSSRAFADRYHQGIVLYNHGDFRDAAEFFSHYIRHDPEQTFRCEAEYFLGRSYQREGSFRTAAAKYSEAIECGRSGEYFGAAWLRLAYCRRVLGLVDESISTYDEFAGLYPDAREAPEALWEKARLLEEERRLAEAVEAFRALSALYPDDENVPDALFRAGLCLFKMGRYGDADAAFASLLLGADDETSARALFWAGKSRDAMGRSDEAAERYREAAESAPDSYYGVRALARIADEKVEAPEPPPPAAAALPRDGVALFPLRRGAEIQGFAAWLARWYDGVYIPTERIELLNTLNAAPAFIRADTFLALHMERPAGAELSLLEDAFGSDPRMLDVLIGYYERNGLNRRAIRVAERILGLSPAGTLGDAPAYLRKRICPRHFSALVEEECRSRGVDPNVFYSLIRQESLFQPDAVSWVGARGLSQIMPGTGRWIARRIGERRFHTRDLNDPETNVRFGAFYLGLQLQDFDGDLMRALAAYNGGPENVPRWWAYGGGSDSDVFVEDIGFSQTSDYVRKVYLYSQFYRRLYGAPARGTD